MNYPKQTATNPAFSDVLWSKPEQKAKRGKIAIIGGNTHSITAVMDAYQSSQKAGVGEAQVVLPDSLRSVAGQILERGVYAPRNPSGGFSKQSLDVFLEIASWANAALFPGDVGHNSETLVAIERFIEEYDRWISFSSDIVDDVAKLTDVIRQQGKCLLVVDMRQLQDIVAQQKLALPLKHDSNLNHIIQVLIEVSRVSKSAVALGHHQKILLAYDGDVSITELEDALPQKWQTTAASYAIVWLVQQANKPLEAMTCGLYEAFFQE